MKHIPVLDGLRAIAVLMVFYAHMGGNTWFGGLGVDIFFILSGFLITRILIANKEKGVGFKSFYIRRATRIFPLYYALMLLMLVIYGPAWDVLSACTYTYNLAMGWYKGGETHAPVGMTWSLCVEEHFYLLWPMAVLWLSSKAASRIAAGTVVFGFVTSALVCWWAWNTQSAMLTLAVYQNTLCHCSTLAVGSLIAFSEKDIAAKPYKLVAMGCAGIFGYYSIHRFAFNVLDMPNVWGAVISLARSFALAFAIFSFALWASYHPRWSPARFVLTCKPLCGIGAISYGLYLLHGPILHWMDAGKVIEQGDWMKGAMALALIFSLAALSYRFFESPIRDWGRKASGKTRVPAIGATA